MTVVFYLHVGHLIATDSVGIAVSWGKNTPGWKARGESMFAHNLVWEFPWWVKPSAIRHRLWVASIRRKQAKHNG